VISEQRDLKLTINGEEKTVRVPAAVSLLDFLRDEVGLLSPKTGCRVGYCGACTVIMDDLPVHSCCLLAVQAEGRRVETVEGDGPEVSACQQAFAEANAVQCGVCIPGMIMSAAAIVRCGADEHEMRDIMLGNICRCGGYSRIMKAVDAARSSGGGNR
jgi:aerobic-type carbon monoxide dehydrogenase small subunit (CoxS/CutS family)